MKSHDFNAQIAENRIRARENQHYIDGGEPVEVIHHEEDPDEPPILLQHGRSPSPWGRRQQHQQNGRAPLYQKSDDGVGGFQLLCVYKPQVEQGVEKFQTS